MSFFISQPETEDQFKAYYHLRWKILRAPWQQPEGSETDSIEDACYHLLASDQSGAVIGVARLQFNSGIEVQIRYMAVAGTHRNQGVGRQLIQTLEKHAAETGHKIIVLDAREPALNFYLKLGYRVIKKSYLLFGEIQHFKMLKEL